MPGKCLKMALSSFSPKAVAEFSRGNSLASCIACFLALSFLPYILISAAMLPAVANSHYARQAGLGDGVVYKYAVFSAAAMPFTVESYTMSALFPISVPGAAGPVLAATPVVYVVDSGSALFSNPAFSYAIFLMASLLVVMLSMLAIHGLAVVFGGRGEPENVAKLVMVSSVPFSLVGPVLNHIFLLPPVFPVLGIFALLSLWSSVVVVGGLSRLYGIGTVRSAVSVLAVFAAYHVLSFLGMAILGPSLF